ncbi:MAG: O-antigen ligase family protein [Maribacter dokdonensis]|uniref:O-antigen ligase family protein n=1 Tax=Maribacter dokdonensis TaxID=320912 RepID=UPI0032976F22
MKVKVSLLFGLFLLFLPFTQALTFNIFFPLKISEIILVFLVFVFMQKMYNRNLINALLELKILYAFLFIATISFFINLKWNYPYPTKEIAFRLSRQADSALRLGYIYLNVFAFLIATYIFTKCNGILKYWVYGALAASLYAWYIFFSSAIGIPYIKLIGMSDTPQTIMGIVRSGTFKEGNFFGLFLILSSAVAFYINKNRIAWFLMLTIFSTFSTISIISGILFLFIYFKKFIFKLRNIKIFVLLLPLLCIGLFFFIRSDLYTKYIEQKLFTPVNTITPSNFSKIDRYLTASIAFRAGIHNPILGVGPYNYGLHYDEYNNIDEIVDKQSEFTRQFFKRLGKRAIPNNVYLEVWAEYGILGFSLFSAFLLHTLFISIKNRNLIITAGLIAMYLSLNAFPSFIMLFLWVYLAIPYSIYFSRRQLN